MLRNLEIFLEHGSSSFWANPSWTNTYDAISSHKSDREETTISKHALAARKICASGNRVIWSRGSQKVKTSVWIAFQGEDLKIWWKLELIPSLKLTVRTWKWIVGRWNFLFGWLPGRGYVSFRECNYLAYYSIENLGVHQHRGCTNYHNLSLLCEDSNDTCISIEWRWIVCRQEFQCLLWHQPGTFQTRHSTCAAFEMDLEIHGVGCDVLLVKSFDFLAGKCLRLKAATALSLRPNHSDYNMFFSLVIDIIQIS